MQPRDVVDGRFEVERVAGSGGMGTVYRAADHVTGEQVALKILRPGSGDHTSRFVREIRALQTLRHPGIVRYVADGRTPEGELWLAMEWLEGESLQQRLERSGLTAGESVTVARVVADALGAAHAHGILHRDIKPSNIMLPGGDLSHAKVLDFGVARMADARATRTGIMIGTPGYMAPEQARGGKDVGPRADVFAVGCVLFECLTGRLAFTGDNVMAILAKLLLEDAPRVREIREVPTELDALVARVLSRDVERRPRDGAQLAAELAALGVIDVGERAATVRDTPVALTASERQLLCVVLVGQPGAASDRTLVDPSSSATIDSSSSSRADTEPIEGVAALQRVAEAHGASLVRLVDDSHVVTLAGGGDAGDQAVRGARCALALKAAAPSSAMALATGRGVIAGRWPVGEAIDRAAALLVAAQRASPERVRVDAVTAGLLDTRFDVGGDEAGLWLIGERDIVEVGRTLLGKPTSCVGRERELGVLAGLYEECVSEPRARAAVVIGAAGIGKSRLRYEWLRRVRGRDEPVEVWIGRGDPLAAGSPYALLAPALRRSAGILDGEPIEVRRQKLRARLMRHSGVEVPNTTKFIGELVGVPFDEDVELKAARADPLIMAERVRRAFEHLIALETAASPLVIVLEDVHWGDLPTVKLVDSALRDLPDRPWFVLALARPEVAQEFPRLWADRGAHEIRLDELSKKGSERLVREVLGANANSALVARIVDQAAGNAFYLEELVRAAAEGKGDAMPETVLAVVQARLERLEVDARRVLRAASVYGQQFWPGGIEALLGGATRRTTTRSWIDELVEREVIARAAMSRFPNEDQFYFRHAIVREGAYAMLTEADRKLGHALAGDWLERAGEGDASVLAEHFERGGEGERAIQCYQRAAEAALAASDFAGASQRAERGITAGAGGEQFGALRLVQAEAHKWQGEFAEAAHRGVMALRFLMPGTTRWFQAAGETAECCGKVGDVDELVKLGDSLRNAPDHDHTGEALAARVTATAHCAFQLFNHGRYELAQLLLDRVERVAGQIVEPGVLARIYQARSSRAMFAGDAGAYLESERAAAVQFERAGDIRYACMQRGHVGYACLEIGAYAEAEHWLRIALDEGARLGLANVCTTARHNLGRALHRRGSLDEALAMQTQAADEFHAQGDRRLESGARNYLAEVLLDLGFVERAEREARSALELSTPALRSQVLATLARVVLARGDRTQAAELARSAHELMDTLGGVEEGESLIRLVLAEALAAAGDPGAAAAARRAYERVAERAGKISDPRWRASFLEMVPENARTMALVR